jgi:hypothetical protein
VSAVGRWPGARQLRRRCHDRGLHGRQRELDDAIAEFAVELRRPDALGSLGVRQGGPPGAHQGYCGGVIAADQRSSREAADRVSDILPIAEAVLKVSVIAFMIGNLLAIALETDLKAALAPLSDLRFVVTALPVLTPLLPG